MDSYEVYTEVLMIRDILKPIQDDECEHSREYGVGGTRMRKTTLKDARRIAAVAVYRLTALANKTD